ncbi:MAG: (d)CMP kinase [Mogibacterium sp.]|uniref:(d)CMP kinase n=1 Tax=Mogibacterium sp. TaxID=2049035 RepID=UPI001A472768|nr:(d)CMP kinase [Mogibacterium sp.]MBL6468019.1 (d)CMP kinase [Mogibacterium sp.]
MIRIAIDGPGGAGKSTIAKMVAEKMNMEYIDTGAMYRAIGWMFSKNNVNTEDSAEVQDVLNRTAIDFDNGKIFLNGEDISGEIRTPEISKAASVCSKLPEVRSKLVALQREIAEGKSVVMDGRDIGTNVLPNAEVKIFLTANPMVRAKRRYDQLLESGKEADLNSIFEDIKERDYQDTHRELNPLQQAEDAVLLDTSDMTINQVLDEIMKMAEGKNE